MVPNQQFRKRLHVLITFFIFFLYQTNTILASLHNVIRRTRTTRMRVDNGFWEREQSKGNVFETQSQRTLKLESKTVPDERNTRFKDTNAKNARHKIDHINKKMKTRREEEISNDFLFFDYSMSYDLELYSMSYSTLLPQKNSLKLKASKGMKINSKSKQKKLDERNSMNASTGEVWQPYDTSPTITGETNPKEKTQTTTTDEKYFDYAIIQPPSGNVANHPLPSPKSPSNASVEEDFTVGQPENLSNADGTSDIQPLSQISASIPLKDSEESTESSLALSSSSSSVNSEETTASSVSTSSTSSYVYVNSEESTVSSPSSSSYNNPEEITVSSASTSSSVNSQGSTVSSSSLPSSSNVDSEESASSSSPSFNVNHDENNGSFSKTLNTNLVQSLPAETLTKIEDSNDAFLHSESESKSKLDSDPEPVTHYECENYDKTDDSTFHFQFQYRAETTTDDKSFVLDLEERMLETVTNKLLDCTNNESRRQLLDLKRFEVVKIDSKPKDVLVSDGVCAKRFNSNFCSIVNANLTFTIAWGRPFDVKRAAMEAIQSAMETNIYIDGTNLVNLSIYEEKIKPKNVITAVNVDEDERERVPFTVVLVTLSPLFVLAYLSYGPIRKCYRKRKMNRIRRYNSNDHQRYNPSI